jgi:hypothetical protein
MTSRALLGCVLIAGCASAPAREGASPAGGLADLAFHVVAEGPCAKMAVQSVGARTFVVFGDTGYDLHDWAVGEPLAAAQAVVELRDGEAFTLPGFTDGLATNAGGYVPAELRLGGAETRPWLVTVETRYASRGKGALFERSAQGWKLERGAWRQSAGPSPVELPAEAAALPPLPEAQMCPPGARFVKLAAASHARGDVFFAGRCQGDGPVLASLAPIWMAHGAPGARRWVVARAPESHVLDGIVNVALWARRPDDVVAVAYEPFKPPDQRQPYLAHYDGRAWSQVETGLPEGLMSVAGTDDGALWIAAGRALYRGDLRDRRDRRDRGEASAAFAPVALPALRLASNARPETLRIHTVRVLAPGDVWVEGTYRVRLPPKGTEPPSEQRASVLFRSRPGPTYVCDARYPADLAFAKVTR